jgi:hypothetical protein
VAGLAVSGALSAQGGTLSAAALIATPYAFPYDMAGVVIPAAFLARDQIDCGLLRGEQTVMIALFGASLATLVCLGSAPLGPLVMITLLGVILRRAVLSWGGSRFLGTMIHVGSYQDE